MEEGQTLDEFKRVIKVNFKGIKRIKFKCAPGAKWNPQKNACQITSGTEKRLRKLGAKRAVKTKKGKGLGFKIKTVRKTLKALKKRKALGVKDSRGR